MEALVTIASTYRIEVIAEGIENESQLKKLSELGCRFGQGYVFHRPVQPEQYAKTNATSFGSVGIRQSQPFS